VSEKLVQVYDRSKDRNIFFNPAKVEACVIEWTGKKDYSQDIHTFHVYLESGHTLNGEVNDDGKTKILNALNAIAIHIYISNAFPIIHTVEHSYSSIYLGAFSSS